MCASGRTFTAISLCQEPTVRLGVLGPRLPLVQGWHGTQGFNARHTLPHRWHQLDLILIRICSSVLFWSSFSDQKRVVVLGKNAGTNWKGVFRWASKMKWASLRRLWCFLAGFRQPLTNWWSGNTGRFKSAAHPGPGCLALQWQTL